MGGQSSGSGFIISKVLMILFVTVIASVIYTNLQDGFVVTNAHVVESSMRENILVTLSDNRKYLSRIHSIDKQSDIALLKINLPKGESLPIAQLGKSKDLRAGDFVIAIGSPFLLQNSASFGIISAPARHGSEIGMESNRTDYIQTDAAINIGNSGGPLINLDGEVVGINTMKIQGTSGISFAIPIDSARHVIDQLLKNRRVVRPYLGLQMADYYSGDEMMVGAGAASSQPVVLGVSPGSPAAAAGLQR